MNYIPPWRKIAKMRRSKCLMEGPTRGGKEEIINRRMATIGAFCQFDIHLHLARLRYLAKFAPEILRRDSHPLLWWTTSASPSRIVYFPCEHF